MQAIKLLRVEGAKGACRVHYLAGDRVIDALGAAWSRQVSTCTTHPTFMPGTYRLTARAHWPWLT